VHKFLCQHFLHWFEALSLIGKTSDGVRAISLLGSMVKVVVGDTKRTLKKIRTNKLRIIKVPV
jgi:hypothetical protein